MNVSTISVSQDTAAVKIADIKSLKKSQRTEEDDRLLSLYSAVVKRGARVLSLSAAFRQTGLNELHQPRLAIAQGDWPTVFFDPWSHCFSWKRRWQRGNATTIYLAADVFEGKEDRDEISSPVPHVPAAVRPKFHLRNYHILFEVEKWETYPVDPFLLRHVTGDLYVVEAEWELTELEAALLGSMRSGN
jgi:hypothetical protein